MVSWKSNRQEEKFHFKAEAEKTSEMVSGRGREGEIK